MYIIFVICPTFNSDIVNVFSNVITVEIFHMMIICWIVSMIDWLNDYWTGLLINWLIDSGVLKYYIPNNADLYVMFACLLSARLV